jgi:hypothetical protein
MSEERDLKRILEPHVKYGMKLDQLEQREDGKWVASLKSEKTFDGYHFTYDIPVHPLAVRHHPRKVGNVISEEAASVLQSSLSAGDTSA